MLSNIPPFPIRIKIERKKGRKTNQQDNQLEKKRLFSCRHWMPTLEKSDDVGLAWTYGLMLEAYWPPIYLFFILAHSRAFGNHEITVINLPSYGFTGIRVWIHGNPSLLVLFLASPCFRLVFRKYACSCQAVTYIKVMYQGRHSKTRITHCKQR